MARENVRKKNGSRYRSLRARVLASEDDCSLCGKPVDKDLPHLDPGAPEVDHVIPVSLGGDPYARDNARLAHRICNQKKGDGQRRHDRIIAKTDDELVPLTPEWNRKMFPLSRAW